MGSPGFERIPVPAMELPRALARLPPTPRALAVAVLAVAAALVANVALRYAALAAGVSPRNPLLAIPQVAFLTALLCVAGVAVFFVVRFAAPRWKRDPARVWRVVAYAALAVSFVPDLGLIFPALRGLLTFPTYNRFFGGGPGGPPPGGFGGGNGTRTFGAGGPGAPGGFGGQTMGTLVAFLLAMHVVAGVVLTEALARWGLATEAPAPAAQAEPEPASN